MKKWWIALMAAGVIVAGIVMWRIVAADRGDQRPAEAQPGSEAWESAVAPLPAIGSRKTGGDVPPEPGPGAVLRPYPDREAPAAISAPAAVRPDTRTEMPPDTPVSGEASVTNGTGRSDAPPDWDKPMPPPSLPAQVKRSMTELQRTVGPELADRAMEMLSATNAVIRAVGASLLGMQNRMDEQTAARVAADQNLSVPLMVSELLSDNGKQEAAELLAGALSRRQVDPAELSALLFGGGLAFGGGRVALDLAQELMTPEQSSDLLATVASDDLQSYAVRMKAAVDLRDAMAFGDYRNTINGLNAAAGADDALWTEGIGRLAADLAGPLDAHPSVPTLTKHDVDKLLAREYPGMLEDLALRVENVVDNAAPQVPAGTVDRLADRIRELKKQPWMDEQQTALRRLENALPALRDIEKTRPYQIPPGSLPPGID